MNTDELRKLVREALDEMFGEMLPEEQGVAPEATHEIDGDDVYINNLPVPGGNPIDVSIQLTIEKEREGFDADVPFGSGTIHHKYPEQSNLTGWKVVKVLDSATQQPVRYTQSMKDEIDQYMEDYMEQIESSLRDTEPNQSGI